ncbi:MAG: phosphonate metabolism transcriptional regulator PhnF [Pseudomonadota bacterium]
MRDDTHTIWQAIRESLAADIDEGRYAPGDKLPTEAALARRFGVNRHTVRRAVASLVDAGVVYSRRGSGSYVQQTNTEYPLGRRVSFTRNLRAAGRMPSRRILLIETRAADRREAEALRLSPDDQVHSYDGLSYADDQPLAIFRSVFPANRLPGLPEALARLRSTTESLRAVGVYDFTRAWTRVSAQSATAPQALHLRLRAGAPLLQTLGLNVDTDDQPVEYGCSWFSGESVTLTFGRDNDLPHPSETI